ncbi:microtubule organization protein AKNA [Pseudochaenichthys georgianus]|uniref:microtubule organization protein AKNA n=1 Tax=Pseudochaenichthys georgianus TaxID=52239 RepID=UPI00146AB367|nr:microtubule organization protein AKNA [Pseudochaenichthys georgianus]
MERINNTKAGVICWTPAPAPSSPTSSVIYEEDWDGEDEEQTEKNDDFDSQMDDNGIIGLSEALEDAGLVDSDSHSNSRGPLTPEEEDPSGHERETPEELSNNLSEHLSHTESEEDKTLSSYEDLIESFEAQQLAGKVGQRKEEPGTECVSEWDRYTQETDGEVAGERSDRKRENDQHRRERGTTHGFSEEEIEKTNSQPYCGADLSEREPVRVSTHHRRISPPASPLTALSFPHLLHFTPEEMAAAQGIDTETLPDNSAAESLPESHRSHRSPESSTRCPEVKPRASLQPADMFADEGTSNHRSRVSKLPSKGQDKSDKQPSPSPRKLRQPSPEATYPQTRSLGTAKSLKFKQKTASPDGESRIPRPRSNAAEVNESRKGPLSYRIPDFSNVEPRVFFPKDGYTPPKSTRCFKRESSSPGSPFMFKSPADIVKEVLLNSHNTSPASPDSCKPISSALNSSMPQDFRSRLQASDLLDQLQEDYYRLLTKHADAENTIDRLRLEAKDFIDPGEQEQACSASHRQRVNLFSDPPKPGHLVQSGPNQGSSKMMVLDFPLAQRAEISSASLHPNGQQRSPSACSSTESPDPEVGQQLASILYYQADKFLQQMQTFEHLLKSKRLKPLDQKKGVSQLAEGLDSLERGYLLARDDCKLLQQRGAENSFFDRDRELEGLVFQCGLHMDELKELVERMQREQPISEAPPSPPPHPTPSSDPSEGEETHTQSPAVPVLVDPGEAVEVSTGSEENDEEEETLYLKPQNGKHRHVQQDLAPLRNHFQSLGELSGCIDHSHREEALLFAALRRDVQPGREEEEERQCQENLETSAAQKSDHQGSPPVCTKEAQSSRSSPPPRSASITTPPAHRPRSASITTPPAHRPRSASITTPPAHRPRSASITTPPAHRPRSASITTPPAHRPRSASITTPSAHPPRSPSITTASAHPPRSPSITTPPTHPPRSPSITTASAHRPRSASITTPSAHRPRSASITTPPAHRPRSRRTLEAGESPSSSLSSLSSLNSKLLSGIRRVLSQDGIISPETDSGFVCSESSRLTPAAVASPVHQRASESVPVPQERIPQMVLVPAPSPVPPLLNQPAKEPNRTRSSRSRTEQRRRILSCSPQRCVPLTGQTRAGSGTSEFGPESDSSPTVSEHRFTQSINSSPSFSLASALGHHDDPLSALSSSQAENCNDAIQTLQVELRRMRESRDSCLRNKNPVRAAHHNTSTPIRPGERRGDVRERINTRPVDEDEEFTLRRTTRKRTPSSNRPRTNISTGSERASPQPLVSRCTQTSTAAPDSQRSHTHTVGSRTQPRQQPGVSAQVCEAADVPDGRGWAPLCPQCLSRGPRGRSEVPVGGDREQPHSSGCRLCPLCGRHAPYGSTEPAPPTHTTCQPAESPHRAQRGGYFAAAALLQCLPVCPPPLLLYSSSPLYVSPSNSQGRSSGVRGRREVTRRKRSRSADKQRRVDSSLERAIRAARSMRHTSGHMARSLKSGLHYQRLLAKACSL